MNKTDIQFFDVKAPSWDQITEINPEKIRHILDVARISESNSALDVGTGTGVLIPYILEMACDNIHIDAVDISEGMLKEATHKHGNLKNVSFMLKDIEGEPIENSYDSILMYCMYPHLSQPEDTVEWLYKVNLNPGGSIVIAFPESKDSINSIHHHNDGSVHSVKLTDALSVKTQFELRGINVDYIEDNDEYYIIRMTKPL